MNQLRALFSGVLLFAFVLIFIVGIAWAVGAQYEQAPGTNESVAGESITVDVGNWTAVDAPDYARSFYDNETVRNSSGATLTEGTDYEWSASNASIYWYSGGNFNDGETASVDYAYTAPVEQARVLKNVFAVPIEVVLPAGVLILLAFSIAGLAIGIYRALGKLGGSRGRGSFASRR
jgi:hypothetical protein